jgi:putative hydroxymethylpyrimidine transport system substrate-binding protein
MEKAGVPTYDELVLVAREDWLRDNGALVRRFIQALQAGTRAVKADPDLGVRAIAAVDKGQDRKFLAESVKETLPVLFPEKAGKPFGWMDPSAWEAFSRWMLKNRLVTTLPNDAALTNEFLPGEGAVAADEDTPGAQ